MTDILEKSLYMGLGLFSLTKERAQEVIDDLVEKGKMSKDESSKAVKDLMDRAEKEKSAFDKKVDQSIQDSVKQLHLATQEDIKEVNKKLDKILKAQE